MNRKNGFTLIELLSVVVILALTFMFVAPKMASLIKEGNNNEVRLIEQKALVSAKKYINNYDTNFLNNFINVGYEKTVFKDDLINSGLMTLDEIEQIEDFRGVQVKLLENDKLEYTISRLSSTKDYTNEEIIQLIDELKGQVNSNNSDSNIFLKSYPVGSIYVSSTNTNPSTIFGGEWELVQKNFIGGYFRLDEAFTPNSNISYTYVDFVRTGTIIRLRLQLKLANNYDGTAMDLGTLDFTKLGITKSTVSYYNYYCGSNLGDGAVMVNFNQETGRLAAADYIVKGGGTSFPANKLFYCDFVLTPQMSSILDSAVSEFHFKRIA